MFTSKHFEVETFELVGKEEGYVRGGRHLFKKLPEAFEGIDADRRDRLGLPGPGAGAEPPRLARGLRHHGQDRPPAGLVLGEGGRSGGLHGGQRHARRGLRRDRNLGPRPAADRRRRAGRALPRGLRGDEARRDARPLARVPARRHGERRRDLPRQHQRRRRVPEGDGPVGAPPLRAGQARSTAPGINCSFAVEQDIDGRATDIALAWAIGLGSPYTFQTTLRSEYKSDIYGERGILLGAVWGIVESLYRRYIIAGRIARGRVRPLRASRSPVRSRVRSPTTGSSASTTGWTMPNARSSQKAYDAAYEATAPVLAEIYDDVASGAELRSVVIAGKRLETLPDAADRGDADVEGRRATSGRRAISARRRSTRSRPACSAVSRWRRSTCSRRRATRGRRSRTSR